VMLFLLRRWAVVPSLETLEEHLLALFAGSAVVLLDPGEPVGEFVIALLSSILDVGLEGPHIAQRGFDGPDEVVVLVFDRAADVGDHCAHLLSVPQERLLPLESSTLVIRCRTQQGLPAARPLVTVCPQCAWPSYEPTARSTRDW